MKTLSNFLPYVLAAVLWPYQLVKQLIVYSKALRWHKHIVNYINNDNYLVEYFANMGFQIHPRSKALVTVIKLPTEMTAAIAGSALSAVDTMNVIEFYVHEWLAGVTNQLEQHSLLDVVTLSTTYIEDGKAVVVMSNIFVDIFNRNKIERYIAFTSAAVTCLLCILFTFVI